MPNVCEMVAVSGRSVKIFMALRKRGILHLVYNREEALCSGL